jgi:archaemetzincin
MIFWDYVLLGASVLLLPLLVYRTLWRRRYLGGPRSLKEHLIRVQGRVAATHDTAAPGESPRRWWEIEMGEGRVVVVVPPESPPATGGTVTVLAVPCATPDAAHRWPEDRTLSAIHVARGAWPEIRWLWWPMVAAAVAIAVALPGVLATDRLVLRPALAAEPLSVDHRLGDQAWSTRPPPSRDALAAMMARLRPLHQVMGPVRPGDWLSQHREPGETFAEYLESGPVIADAERHVIYVMPLGEFTRREQEILSLTSEFLSLFFCLPVKVVRPLPLSVIPPAAQRNHPSWGMHQIHTGYVLDAVLKPRLPRDAMCLIALTATDLWPGAGWNFVFGQASLSERVGVWSIYRNGDLEQGPLAFRLALLRTLKTASHEVGHMFSMQHCTRYECDMCGSNNREEADRRPLALCPECLAKLMWATRCDPVKRYEKLERFLTQQGIGSEAARFARLRQALGR